MPVREACATQFYPGDCARSIEKFLQGFSAPSEPARPVAGVVPHAGWMYSGAVAAKIFEAIRQKSRPETYVIFGAVHRWAQINGIYARGGWQTPFGVLEIDEALASEILAEAGEWIEDNTRVHSGEHSIEVQAPFLKYLSPQAKIVPIAVNADSRALELGRRVGEILSERGRRAVAIGSTDLTHYGDVYSFAPAGYGRKAHEWMKANDARIVGIAEEMQGAQILEEARKHHNACGAGALAATVEAARAMGAGRGYLVQYTTSFDAAPEKEFEMAVGYGGLLF
jgi:MEMO1 family protein